jgi:predicted metal-dependent hydrolase
LSSSLYTLEEITVEVVRKRVKNINLTVHPPLGHVRISAPQRMSLDTILAFARSKLEWIRRHQARMREQAREAPHPLAREPRYVTGEHHWVWGRPHRLEIAEAAGRAFVETGGDTRLRLRVRPGTGRDGRRALLDRWYRDQVQDAVPPLLERWEPELGVTLERYQVRRMKTRWGSCTPTHRTIRLNSELGTRPPAQLEYILVHELVHLLEPSHNRRFHGLMDHFLPGWKAQREALNREQVYRPEQGELFT